MHKLTFSCHHRLSLELHGPQPLLDHTRQSCIFPDLLHISFLSDPCMCALPPSIRPIYIFPTPNHAEVNFVQVSQEALDRPECAN